jgi:hypothetical protein
VDCDDSFSLSKKKGAHWWFICNDRTACAVSAGLEAFRRSRIALREAGNANFLKEWAKKEEEQTGINSEVD